MQAKDYYKILGVAETADAAEIKRAYRKIAKANHPDQHPGDTAAEERFKEASEAYGVLGDEEKRKKYDALRRYGFGEPGAGFSGAGGGFPGGVRFRTGPGGAQHIHFQGGEFSDVDFADLFGESSPFADVFEQLFAQAGAGRGTAGRRTARRGRRTTRRKAARASSPQDDNFFRVDGLDVHCTVWLKLEQLEAGAKVKVRTPSGKKAIVRVNPGTKIGTVLRLPHMGLTRNGSRGDQYVHVEAVA